MRSLGIGVAGCGPAGLAAARLLARDGHGVTPAYHSHSRWLPFIRDRIVPPFGRLWPATRIQAEIVAGTFEDPLRRLGLDQASGDASSSPVAA